MVWQAKEWLSEGTGWHCGCLDDLGHNSNAWHLPARILGITPAAFVELVINQYKPDYVYFNEEKCLFFYSWKSQTAERKFKNFINAEARKKNFQI